MKEAFIKPFFAVSASCCGLSGLFLLLFSFSQELSPLKILFFLSGSVLLGVTAGLLLYSKKISFMIHRQKQLFSILDANKKEILSSLFLQLCYDNEPDTSTEEVISFFQLEQTLRHIAAALIRFPSSAQSAGFHKDTRHEIQEDLLLKIHAASEPFFPSFWFWENSDTAVGLIEIAENLSDNVSLLGIHKLGLRLQEVCPGSEEKPVIIAFGSVVSSKELIHCSYEEAAELLNHKIHNHLSAPYSYQEFQRKEIQFDYNKQQLLARYIRLGKAEDAVSFLNSYFSVIHANPHTSVLYVREITSQILSLMSSVIQEYPPVCASCLPRLNKAEEYLEELSHVHDFGEFLLPLVQDICTAVASASANKGKLKTDKLISWINDNYNQDLSLESMASYIGCSPSYTSRLFKRETGCDIISYLSSVRISHAKELLCQTKMTLEEISVSVGFNHQQTFIRNFKKLTGLTPTEYRNSDHS